MRNSKRETKEDQTHYIFRAWRRHPKTGEIMWAKDYGKRAWRIPVQRRG